MFEDIHLSVRAVETPEGWVVPLKTITLSRCGVKGDVVQTKPMATESEALTEAKRVLYGELGLLSILEDAVKLEIRSIEGSLATAYYRDRDRSKLVGHALDGSQS